MFFSILFFIFGIVSFATYLHKSSEYWLHRHEYFFYNKHDVGENLDQSLLINMKNARTEMIREIALCISMWYMAYGHLTFVPDEITAITLGTGVLGVLYFSWFWKAKSPGI